MNSACPDVSDVLSFAVEYFSVHQDRFFPGRSTRTSRNSSDPLIKRRFRLAFSSLSAVRTVKLSIAFDARSARAARCRSEGADLVFTVRPSSTSRRMASERDGLSSCLVAHWSTATPASGDKRTAVTGWTPPFFFGRPRDFLFTEIDFFIISVYRKDKPRGSANFRPGYNPNHEGAYST
jgi:hypothetical protein